MSSKSEQHGPVTSEVEVTNISQVSGAGVLSSFLLLVLFVTPSSAFAAPKDVVLRVVHEGQPVATFAVDYFDGDRMIRATTDARGIVVLGLSKDLKEWDLPWRLAPASEDYVFRDLRGGDRRWRVRAVRSATWRQRTHPRACDVWRRTMDIPRGSLPLESAGEYDKWYSSLAHESELNCVLLAKIEAEIGSKAPWYFFELKAMPPGCVDGKQVPELDWTGWYRRLLEEATAAAPGVCVSDWERWWAAQGYPALPKRPASDLPPN